MRPTSKLKDPLISTLLYSTRPSGNPVIWMALFTNTATPMKSLELFKEFIERKYYSRCGYYFSCNLCYALEKGTAQGQLHILGWGRK